MNPYDILLIIGAGLILMYGSYSLAFMVAWLIREWRAGR